MTNRLRLLVAATALAFLAVHLAALPRTLEDIDSVNFALGVESFDVADHRPHPPGYPVYVALAKASTRAVAVIAPGWDRDHRAAAGLAIWSVLAGTAAVFVFTELWLAIGLSPMASGLSAVVAVASPLFWLTASRPLTDTLGLVAAVIVQTWFVRGLRAIREGRVRLPAEWLWGAAGTGFIIGIRSQSVWLTGPLFLWCLGELVWRRRHREALLAAGACAAGALLWAVPLVWQSGGMGAYLRAVRSQGTEDLANIELLATTPTWKLFVLSMRRTFVDGWALAPLARVALALALIGIGRLVLKARRVLIVLCFCFWPYLIFHLTFQETQTIRYGLPLLVPVAGLAVIGLASFGRRAAVGGTAVLVAASLVVVQPQLVIYAREGAPVFRAFEDMQRALRPSSGQPALQMHHQVWWGVRRAMDWYRPDRDLGPQPFPGDHEWLRIVDHFRAGNTRPVWFLGHLARNDLAAFDPRTTVVTGRYELPVSLRNLIGGTRLDSVRWWTIGQPAWMVGRGWSLTPELAGVTNLDKTGPDVRPAEAFLRRDPRPARLMIAGRYLGADTGTFVTLSAILDGKLLVSWRADGHPRSFVQWIDLPAGVPDGPGTYATLTIRSAPGRGGATSARVGLEQFDLAPLDGVVYAFAEGWHELESEPETGRQWRWTSGSSTLVVRGAEEDRQLKIAGESPLKYFDRPPHVVVRAGTRVLATLSPSADFSAQVTIPADALRESGGRVTIDTDETWKPSQRGAQDSRDLGLRLFTTTLQ